MSKCTKIKLRCLFRFKTALYFKFRTAAHTPPDLARSHHECAEGLVKCQSSPKSSDDAISSRVCSRSGQMSKCTKIKLRCLFRFKTALHVKFRPAAHTPPDLAKSHHECAAGLVKCQSAPKSSYVAYSDLKLHFMSSLDPLHTQHLISRDLNMSVQ